MEWNGLLELKACSRTCTFWTPSFFLAVAAQAKHVHARVRLGDRTRYDTWTRSPVTAQVRPWAPSAPPVTGSSSGTAPSRRLKLCRVVTRPLPRCTASSRRPALFHERQQTGAVPRQGRVARVLLRVAGAHRDGVLHQGGQQGPAARRPAQGAAVSLVCCCCLGPPPPPFVRFDDPTCPRTWR